MLTKMNDSLEFTKLHDLRDGAMRRNNKLLVGNAERRLKHLNRLVKLLTELTRPQPSQGPLVRTRTKGSPPS